MTTVDDTIKDMKQQAIDEGKTMAELREEKRKAIEDVKKAS